MTLPEDHPLHPENIERAAEWDPRSQVEDAIRDAAEHATAIEDPDERPLLLIQLENSYVGSIWAKRLYEAIAMGMARLPDSMTLVLSHPLGELMAEMREASQLALMMPPHPAVRRVLASHLERDVHFLLRQLYFGIGPASPGLLEIDAHAFCSHLDRVAAWCWEQIAADEAHSVHPPKIAELRPRDPARMTKEAEACAFVLNASKAGEPLPPKRAIAKIVGCDPSLLSKSPAFCTVYDRVMKQSASPPPSGWKSSEGQVEAFDPDGPNGR